MNGTNAASKIEIRKMTFNVVLNNLNRIYGYQRFFIYNYLNLINTFIFIFNNY